jgi:uncharacterized membrane protein YfhO
MATESADERSQHIRSVTVTSMASALGIVAAVVSSMLTADLVTAGEFAQASRAQAPKLVLIGAILVQFPLVRVLGFYDEDEFSAKDMLFIAFMTFSFWFVTWGILLATGAAF